ncbi:MAG: OprO/OprP family phosphate-selective porin, partial [Planctomycetota bacterium]
AAVSRSGSWSATRGFGIMTDDEGNEMRIGARVDLDANFVGSDDFDVTDQIGFRRSRIMLEGMAYGTVGYRAVVDFNGPSGGTEFADLYMTLDNFLVGSLKAGQFFEPFGLEANTYSENINISQQERSLATTAVAPGRGTGVMVHDFVEDSNFGWSVGVFSAQGNNVVGDAADNFSFGGASTGIGGQNIEGNLAVTARATWAPMMSEDGSEVLHLGASFTTRGTKTTGPTVGGAFAAQDDDTRFGVEAAYVAGPMSFQAEYLNAAWGGDAAAGTADIDFDGLYVQGAYMITGETRSYSHGTFGGVTPNSDWNGFGGGGSGALEASVRWSTLSQDIGGAEADSDVIDVGLNWYMNQNTRFMAGISLIDSDAGDAEALNEGRPKHKGSPGASRRALLRVRSFGRAAG